jgi:hypothetical protein
MQVVGLPRKSQLCGDNFLVYSGAPADWLSFRLVPRDFIVELYEPEPDFERHGQHVRDLLLYALRANGVLSSSFVSSTAFTEHADLSVEVVTSDIYESPAVTSGPPRLEVVYDENRRAPEVSFAGLHGVGVPPLSWQRTTYGKQVQEWLAEVMGEVVDGVDLDVPVNRWLLSSERLLGAIEELLGVRDELEHRLKRAYGDLDVARARIAQLEAARDQLREERYGVKEWTTPTMIVGIASLVATAITTLPVFGLGAGADDGDRVTNNITNVYNISQEVLEDCGAPVVLPPEPPASG